MVDYSHICVSRTVAYCWHISISITINLYLCNSFYYHHSYFTYCSHTFPWMCARNVHQGTQFINANVVKIVWHRYCRYSNTCADTRMHYIGLFRSYKIFIMQQNCPKFKNQQIFISVVFRPGHPSMDLKCIKCFISQYIHIYIYVCVCVSVYFFRLCSIT